MKGLFALGFAALLALPAVAEEKAKAVKTPKQATKATAAPAPVAESPLAAAARRSGRLKSSSAVITDDMVKNSTGRLSTSESGYTGPVLPAKIEPSSEVVLNEQRAKAKAEAGKKAATEKAEADSEARRRSRLAAMADEYEDGVPEDDDPAKVEEELAKKAPEAKKP